MFQSFIFFVIRHAKHSDSRLNGRNSFSKYNEFRHERNMNSLKQYKKSQGRLRMLKIGIFMQTLQSLQHIKLINYRIFQLQYPYGINYHQISKMSHIECNYIEYNNIICHIIIKICSYLCQRKPGKSAITQNNQNTIKDVHNRKPLPNWLISL